MSPSSFKKLVTTLMLFFLLSCSLLPVAISQGVSIEEEAAGLNRSAVSEGFTENYGDTSIESLMNTTEIVSGSNSPNFVSMGISSPNESLIDLPIVNMRKQDLSATAYPSAAVDTKEAGSEDTTKDADQKTLQTSFEPFGLPELLDLIRQNSKTSKQDDKTGTISKAQTIKPSKVNMKVDKSRMSFLLSKPNSNGTEAIEKLNHEFKGLLSKIKYQIIDSKWSTMSADDKTKFLNCVVCINNIYDVEDLLHIKVVSLIDENRDFVQFASYRKSEERMLANINNQSRVEYMLRKAIWCESMPLAYTHLRLLNKLVIAKLTEKYENILERKLNIQLEHLKSTMKRLRPSRTTDLSSGVSKVDKHIRNLEAE